MSSIHESSESAGVDPLDAVTACIEGGCSSLLLREAALPADFFDLSTGVAGEVMQKLVLFGLRAAVVTSGESHHSAHFGDFAREANRGDALRFFASEDEARRWLESEQPIG